MKESARSLSTEGVQETRTTSEPWESVKARVEGKKLCVETAKAKEALTYQQATMHENVEFLQNRLMICVTVFCKANRERHSETSERVDRSSYSVFTSDLINKGES